MSEVRYGTGAMTTGSSGRRGPQGSHETTLFKGALESEGATFGCVISVHRGPGSHGIVDTKSHDPIPIHPLPKTPAKQLSLCFYAWQLPPGLSTRICRRSAVD